jgi:hypothetical protein
MIVASLGVGETEIQKSQRSFLRVATTPALQSATGPPIMRHAFTAIDPTGRRRLIPSG